MVNNSLDDTNHYLNIISMLEIHCYSGYKGEEKPLKIIIDNQEHFIEAILRKELIEDFKTRERKTIFWCQTKNSIYRLTRLSTGEWQIAEQPQTKRNHRLTQEEHRKRTGNYKKKTHKE